MSGTISIPNVLLAAILAEPDDDLPRLAFADWLEENGEYREHRIRADFIRWQLAGSKGREWPWCIDMVPEPFFGQHAWQTMKDGPKVVMRFGSEGDFQGPFLSYSRGFVFAIGCSLRDWQESGPRLVRSHPVQRVELLGAIREIVGMPTIWRGPHEGSIPNDLFVVIACQAGIDKCRNPDHVAAGTHMHFPSHGQAEYLVSLGCLLWAESQKAAP